MAFLGIAVQWVDVNFTLQKALLALPIFNLITLKRIK